MPTRFSSVPSTATVIHQRGVGAGDVGDICDKFSQKLAQALGVPVFATYTLPNVRGLVDTVIAQVLQKVRGAQEGAASTAAAAATAAAGEGDEEEVPAAVDR